MDPYWWVALAKVPGVGPLTYRKLLQRFGSPEAVFRASLSEIREVERVGITIAKAIKGFDGYDSVEAEFRRMERMGIQLAIMGQPSYPAALLSLPDPPPCLFIKGTVVPADAIAVAIVGSRAATQYGLQITHRIARGLARRGVTVISGMARGIDSEAHRGALAEGGRTIAVLGSGLNVIYPPENRGLFDMIASNGAVITEYPLDTEPDAGHFPARNRIISGLSLGVAIVEAAPNSGSLITARLALEQGREVFAVPGNVDSIRSRGTNRLIRTGAHLVETAEDILEVLAPMLASWSNLMKAAAGQPEPKAELTADETRILELIGGDPVHIDELIKMGGLGTSSTTAALLQLELKGCIRQLSGKRFARSD